jgi:hypothetical protein
MPPIRRLRLITVGFAAGMVAVAAALGASLPPGGSSPVGWAAAWAGLSLASTLIGAAVRSRMADRVAAAPGPGELAGRYGTRTIAGLAFAEVPALAGVAAAYWIDGSLPILVAVPISLALLVWMGPTNADLRALQERVDSAGTGLDVVRVLAAPAPRPAP